ncbi:MAG: methyltransferase domain-containing protein [Treponema sp.]
MSSVYPGLAVMVQARLNSSRLPRKILRDLGGMPLIVHTLTAMKQVPAERYILACDYASVSELTPLAEQCGYTLIAGSETDVLGRFCTAVRRFESSLRPIRVILRATADNPFLFAEAAAESVKRFAELDEPDYFTFTGLPHGSGIEILKAKSLLTAEKLTDSPYDHEHVGPALYRHPDTFVCIRETAPLHWYAPHLRVTVDTQEDFEHAQMMIRYLNRTKRSGVPSADAVIKACRYADKLVVFVPSVKEGQGTGHLHRICSLMQELSGKLRCVLYIRSADPPFFVREMIKKAEIRDVVSEIPERACLFVLDNFRTGEEEIMRLKRIAPVIGLDEGGEGRMFADYLIDILPSLPQPVGKTGQEALRANLSDIRFIPLPHNRKSAAAMEKYEKDGRRFVPPAEARILVVCGGENAAQMALPIAYSLASLGGEVSVIDPTGQDYVQKEINLYVYPRISGLKERLCEWDIIVTHYGFTAFEALAAGCAVILIAPTAYHYELGIHAGFSTMPAGIPSADDFKAVLTNGIKIPPAVTPASQEHSLGDCIVRLSGAAAYRCPLCSETSPLPPAGRAENKTVCFCPSCKIHYVSFVAAEEKNYGEQYFFEEYQAQYGKTYLEDFEAIKTQGLRRMGIINVLYTKTFHAGKEAALFEGSHHGTKRLLDIGCAYGPFLAAAKESGWSPVGTDISAEAIEYVCGTLHIPACHAPFPALPEQFPFMLEKTFTDKHNQTISISLEAGGFSAVTLWFVIEHFQDLDSVLQKVSGLLIGGGIFAFSTPNLSGVSGRWNRQQFFAQSPSDHYSIWDRRFVSRQLEQYGFIVKKTVSIGHHPERFPGAARIKKGGFLWKALLRISKLFKLGDSMEVYAVKRGSIDD